MQKNRLKQKEIDLSLLVSQDEKDKRADYFEKLKKEGYFSIIDNILIIRNLTFNTFCCLGIVDNLSILESELDHNPLEVKQEYFVDGMQIFINKAILSVRVINCHFKKGLLYNTGYLDFFLNKSIVDGFLSL